MITTTLRECLQAKDALSRWAAVRLPVKTAYHVLKIVRCCQREMAHYETLRDALVKELGAERPITAEEGARGFVGTLYEVLPEHLPAYVQRLHELHALVIEIPLEPLTLAELAGAEQTTASDLLELGTFLTVE